MQMTTSVICDTNCQCKISEFFLNTQIFIDEDKYAMDKGEDVQRGVSHTRVRSIV